MAITSSASGAGGSGYKTGTGKDLVGTAASPIDPLLGPLQDNGGPTFTMALLPGPLSAPEEPHQRSPNRPTRPYRALSTARLTLGPTKSKTLPPPNWFSQRRPASPPARFSTSWGHCRG